MDYKQGDILKLSDEGLDAWAHGKRKALERCIAWRFELMEIDKILIDKWGDKTLVVRRIDVADDEEIPSIAHWTRRYLDKVEVKV